jgi:dTDP-glucose 4,6-dehydratase
VPFFKSVLVTGGAGFIGSNFVRYLASRHEGCDITVLDALTYAGNLQNLEPLVDDGRVTFIKGSITDAKTVEDAMRGCDIVFNFAAETHVDRSIRQAGTFIDTDVLGTYTLLRVGQELGLARFVQISTDEVYGSSGGPERAEKAGRAVGEVFGFDESAQLRPGNPYSASKCGGDLMCQAFFNTFGMPVVITRSANNFGPYQHVEKFIPLFVTNALEGKELPLYGDGGNRRDWIYVDDNCRALELVAERGTLGEIYNIGTEETRANISVAEMIVDILDAPKDRIVFIEDRKGHDREYRLDCSKMRALGWSPQSRFDDALERTVHWYRDNAAWWTAVKNGAYRKYYEDTYGQKIKKGKKHGV